ncbi:helix-turn-helix domain-containing protein [Paraburkholderia sp. SARCC-3016]|uniref:helix-turn-helix domain-containing protein n=1 Tax=Paraburkholderia sp. SARCC-3016 TaxID=3058611 RepID=UPI0028080A2D|nr:helix-turn-helix domain-containing protein [Paraburkholderia sp. SARCC-3016]MDQ7981368.1 helix-turn-helix domain-containing protein [Paraburkholderia sp. SARCC-3016]
MKRKPLREVLAENVRAQMSRNVAIDTQQKLAKRAGISQSSVARVLAGNVDTQISILAALAAAIGVQPGRLLEDEASAPDLQIDRERFAKLPIGERAKIQSYIDFVMAQPSADEAGALSLSQKLTQTKEQQDQTRRAAQRPISKDSLSIHEKKDENLPGNRKNRRGNQ